VNPAILVTGAGSGIGRRLAERLASLGHRVYATARNEGDLRSLATLDTVVPLRLDVRDPAQIERAAAEVAAAGHGLRGLVNNAGVGGIGPIASWTDAELEEIFAVNALGPVRMSRAFLPLLLQSKGRIVNVGSQGGSISKKYFGPYTMTKHALEAFTIALDEEVAPFGMRASIVQPGGVATSIGEKSVRGDLGRFRRAPAPFDEEGRAIAEALDPAAPAGGTGGGEQAGEAEERAGEAAERAEAPESEENRKPSSPDLVADAILHALFDPEPRRRYLVGTRWEGNRVIDTLFERLADANACPSLRYSRDELVAWLDRALAGE
jgi:NAD(P)-dependent dehydrogenase (short-subunit alcohol dehydrogenase family)